MVNDIQPLALGPVSVPDVEERHIRALEEQDDDPSLISQIGSYIWENRDVIEDAAKEAAMEIDRSRYSRSLAIDDTRRRLDQLKISIEENPPVDESFYMKTNIPDPGLPDERVDTARHQIIVSASGRLAAEVEVLFVPWNQEVTFRYEGLVRSSRLVADGVGATIIAFDEELGWVEVDRYINTVTRPILTGINRDEFRVDRTIPLRAGHYFVGAVTTNAEGSEARSNIRVRASWTAEEILTSGIARGHVERADEPTRLRPILLGGLALGSIAVVRNNRNNRNNR